MMFGSPPKATPKRSPSPEKKGVEETDSRTPLQHDNTHMHQRRWSSFGSTPRDLFKSTPTKSPLRLEEPRDGSPSKSRKVHVPTRSTISHAPFGLIVLVMIVCLHFRPNVNVVYQHPIPSSTIHDIDNVTDNSSSQIISEERFNAPFKNNEFIFVAFYYPWYKRSNTTWTKHGTQGSTPLLGAYGSDEVEVAEQHIEMAIRGGIDVFAISWWNKEAPTSINFGKGMLKASNIDQIKFTMLYESKGALPESVNGNFTDGTLALDKFIDDMIFFRDTYFGHPSYLHINGRPVVYVYLTRSWQNFEANMLDRVKEEVGEDVLFIADEPFYSPHVTAPSLSQNGIQENGKPMFEAYTSYNMYSFPRVKEGESAADYMFREAMPVYEKWSNETVFYPHVLGKYHDFRDGHKPLLGDTGGLLAQLNTFACLPRPVWYENELPNLIFITSFNEWWEGTSIEPDAEDRYGYKYLDAIKAFKELEVECHENEQIKLVE